MGKRKKSKKGRKYKGFDSTSKKRGRDEVTGLSIELRAMGPNGAKTYTLENDKIFEMVDVIGRLNRVEAELSSDTVILNAHIFDLNGDLSAAIRDIFKGDFTYDKHGLLSKTKMLETTNWTKSAPFNSSKERGNIRQGELKMPGFIPDGGDKWNRISTEVYSFSIDGGASLEDPKSDFFSYASSKFYEDDWWNNPFDTNLI